MALIQSSAVGNSTGGADLTVTLTNVVQGSLLTLEVAFAQLTNGNAPTTPPGWTAAQNPAGQIITLGVAWSGSCIFYKENAAAGTHTAMIVQGGTVGVMSAVASEWVSGLASGALDKSTNAANAAGTTGGSGTTAATANAGELVIAAYGFLDNTGTPHANCGVSSPATTGYTALGVNQDNTTTGTAFQASYKYVTSTGTQVAAWTYTDASAGVGTIATFKLAPRIDTQPTPQTANVGGTATFTIAATTSNGTLSYQWKVNGSNVGTDSTSYTTGTLTNSNQWDQITCVVTDTNGSTTSNAATLFIAFAAAGTGPRRRNVVGAYPTGSLGWLGVSGSSPDVTVALTGQSISTAQGTLSRATDKSLNGQSTAFTQGTLTPVIDKALSGQSTSFSQGTVSPASDKTISGQSITSGQGTVVPNIDKALTGQSATLSQGTITYNVSADVTVALTGQSIGTAQGTLTSAIDKALSGQSVGASQGSTVAGADKALSSQSASIAQGSLTPNSNITLVGLSATFGQGTVTYAPDSDITIALVGQQIGLSQGTITYVPETVASQQIFWGKSPLKSRKKLREEEIAREQEEREFLGILPKAQKIIKREVAKELKKPNGNYESLLSAFAKAEIQYKNEYQRLYLQELRRQEEEQEDEEIALLLMM